MRKTDFDLWKRIDLPALWAILDFQGFRIDIDKWNNLARSNKQKALDISQSLPFNPRSPKQVKPFLAKRGFPGLKDTREPTLQQAIRAFPDTEAARYAQLILDSRGYFKLASTYGEKFIDDSVETVEYNGEMINVVYGDYAVIGAETGRMSCKNPNLQNIPARETNAFRECFIARPGNKLVLADYRQQEPRLAAYISGDKKMIQLFREGEDIYIMAAKMMFGKSITKDDPLRKRIKATVLGTNYGLSAYGLAIREGISEKEAEEIITKFIKTFPDFAAWMNKQRKKKSYAKTILGRRIYLNPYSNQCDRNALNAPIQGSASDMTKLALAAIHQHWAFPCPFGVVAVVHDEIVLDVPEEHAEAVANYARVHMIRVAEEMCPGVPFDADIHIGDNWAKE